MAEVTRYEIEPQALLCFSRSPSGQSFISRQRVGYPFHITRPFYFDSEPPGALTLYLQSVSGGIYQGENLSMTCTAGPDSAAHVTTQAATIVHRMPAEKATQTVFLEALDGALLEYLPDPLIMFPGARLTSRIDITAHPKATVIASESFTHHDPDGENRRFDSFFAETRVRDPAGALLAMDRYDVAGAQLGEGATRVALWPSQGSLIVLNRNNRRSIVETRLKQAFGSFDSIYGGVSTLPNDCGLIVRLLATDGAALRTGLQTAWEIARSGLYGASPGCRRK